MDYVPRSRLRLHRRISPLATLFRLLRMAATLGLVISLIGGIYRYVTRPLSVGALEFTPHVVGVETGAVGVLGVDASDLDHDGDIDIVTAGSDGVKVYIHQPNGSFEEKIVDDVRAERVQIVDLNNDGVEDLLVQLKEGPGVKWYANNGDMEFSGTTVGANKVRAMAAGDINHDGANDIVTSTDEGGLFVLRRWMNDGTGGFTSTTLSSDSKVTAIGIGNLDKDDNDYPDIVTGGDNGLQHWDTSDGTTWSRADIDEGKPNRTTIVVADMDGNGYNDIVTGDQDSNVVAVYWHIDHATFKRAELSGDADALTIDPVDLDEDGDEDVVVAAQDDNSIFWFNNGSGDGFTKETLASNLQSVFGVKVVDIDNDNDFDFVTGDHFRGTVWWYERTAAKPVASKPDNVRQTTDGAGRITFDTTISDADRDATKARIQYSTDGIHWYKPWLLKVTADNGTVDLKNNNGYQAGTNDVIDTQDHDSVKLTFLWDTKSIENTGGPILGDINTVQLRVIPNDGTGNGEAAVSSKFRVDNLPPSGLGNLKAASTDSDQVTLTWDVPSDSSPFTYSIYYGTDHAAVLSQTSDVWNNDDDTALEDVSTSTTTITGLKANQTYTFKIFATDEFGNSVGAPSIEARTVASSSSGTTPTPAPTLPPGATPTPSATPTPTPAGASPTPSSSPSATPTPDFFATPTPSGPPLTTANNQAPVADAGVDQVVNPSALVILDGSGSYDPDGDSLRLNYSWRQLSGPKVDLISERTATPSFSAGEENQTYIFSLTVRDPLGASSSDTVTIATRSLVNVPTTPVDVQNDQGAVVNEGGATQGGVAVDILKPLDIFFLLLALITTIVSLVERAARAWRDKTQGGQTTSASAGNAPRGMVVHYRTGDPIAGASVMVYGSDGKLRTTERTTSKGEFETLFPAGQYTIGVEAQGFTFAPAAAASLRLGEGIVYTGGKLTVPDGNKPLRLVIPMKPTGQEVSSAKARLLHIWQAFQRIGRVLSWPIFIAGAFINTALIFLLPSASYLLIEVLYVVLVIIKVALEVRVTPAYGLVRDAITHVPLDLAVVRLFEAGTNRLVMTRVTNSQGKFFALPPAGTYTVTVTKPGYAVFSKDQVKITSEQDSVLQVTADLMPVAPQGGLQAARAAVI